MSLNREELSFSQWVEGSQKIGSALRQYVSPGDNVGLLLPNLPGFPLAFMGILHAGCPVVPLNFLLQPPEMISLIQHSGMKALLTDEPLFESAGQLAATLENPPKILKISDLLHSETVISPAIEDDPHSMALILYTSGTTGDPKGVMLSHHNIISNVDAFHKVFRFSNKDEIIIVLPLFHTFAQTTNMIPSAFFGSKQVLVPRFQPRPLLDLLLEMKSGILTAVPSIFNLLSRLPGQEKLEGIRAIISGGAALPAEIQERFEKRFQTEIFEGYGLTEAAPVVCTNRPGNNRRGTIGPPLDGVEVQVRDERGNILPAGQDGQLYVRGPNVMLGYYRRQVEEDHPLTPDGWLKTGDMARLNEDGFVRIVGRKKELIISSGMNIYPRQIEEVLLSHPAVQEAAVIPMEDPLRGEAPRAVICPSPGQTVDPGQLKQFCMERLADYKVPRRIEIVEQLPKTPTGKISKKDLISMFQNHSSQAAG